MLYKTYLIVEHVMCIVYTRYTNVSCPCEACTNVAVLGSVQSQTQWEVVRGVSAVSMVSNSGHDVPGLGPGPHFNMASLITL